MREVNKKLYGDKRDKSEMTPPLKPSVKQIKYDRLASKASKQNLSPFQQRHMDRLGAQIAKDPKTMYSIGLPMPTRGTLNNDAFEPPTSGPGAPLPSNKPNPAIIPDKPLPNYGTSSPMPPGYNMGTLPAGPGAMPPMGSMPPMGDTGGGMVGTWGGRGYDPATGRYDLGTARNLGTAGGGSPPNYGGMTMKKGGKVKNMASGGMTSKTSSASKRGDGIAQRGKTKGRMC
jgi:hypothetical protein